MYRIVKIVQGKEKDLEVTYKIQKFYGIWGLGFWMYMTYACDLFGNPSFGSHREFDSCEEAEEWLQEYLSPDINYCVVEKIIK